VIHLFYQVSNVKNSIYQYTKHNMMSTGNVKLGGLVTTFRVHILKSCC